MTNFMSKWGTLVVYESKVVRNFELSIDIPSNSTQVNRKVAQLHQAF